MAEFTRFPPAHFLLVRGSWIFDNAGPAVFVIDRIPL